MTNLPTYRKICSLKENILEKANIILRFQDKPTVLLPVGSEWRDPGFACGLNMRAVQTYRPNCETTAIKVDGVKGAVMHEHYHDNREAIMCLKGEVKVTTPQETILLRALDYFIVPVGVMHSLEFLADSLLLVAWQPKFD